MKLIIKITLISTFLLGCQNNKLKNNLDDTSITSEKSVVTSVKHGKLFYEIKSLDSLLFDVAYNTCDTVMGRKLLSKDFEFYHDKGGALVDEPNELASDIMVEDLSWICNETYRKLIVDKMEVYPLYEKNKLYGAIQMGDHQFYKAVNETPVSLEMNAKFIHLWILEGTDWKLKRVFSYDHQKAMTN